MTVIGPTPKQDFWENIVLTDVPGLTPGVYVSPTLTVSSGGIILAASQGVIHLPTVENISSLSSIVGATPGTVAVVLDNGGGNIVLFGYRLVPSPGWYQITVPATLAALQASISYSSTYPYTVGVAQGQRIWKKVVVTIKTAFNGGTTLTIADSDSNVLMAPNQVDPSVPGTYTVEMPGNDNVTSLGSSLLIYKTGSATTGTAVVYAECM